ncbi:hypothetical protein [Bordetella bronchiseptica]|uniref:gp53-like domain-containing protein n=1 Tax=Bordetella bronchiseptica TaxID=518 RepID=UPI001267BDE8|nr:hypothetical protein [Bordetella bronchiseptica]
MQTSDSPSLIPVPFANSGAKNSIPTSASPTPGLASLETGFPPATMTPIVAGGIPPAGADFNGILNMLSAASRWSQAGGGYTYNAAFSAAIGGYPRGSVLDAAAGGGRWLNLVDNNTNDPDSGGSNWVALGAGIASTSQAQDWVNDNVVLTPKKLVDAFGGPHQNISAQGFQKLPGGLILQVIYIPVFATTANTTVTQEITYPIAFPTFAQTVQVTAATTTPARVLCGYTAGAPGKVLIHVYSSDTTNVPISVFAAGR